MKHKYFRNNKQKSDMDKTVDIYRAINSTNVEDKDYRDIFDDAVKFAYGESLIEYSEKSINAIMVNDIRHNCSNYDKVPKQVYKINRTNNDYEQYKNSVLEKISVAYPPLTDECNKQKRRFDMVKVYTEVG